MASESETILGAGGIAALATLILGAITKFMLDRKKQDNDHESETIERLQERINELEKANQECMRRDAEQREQIGFLKARVAALEELVSILKGQQK